MRKLTIVYLATIVGLTGTLPAHAYIDPGTGTLIVQSIIGGAAAAMTIAGVYIAKIRSVFNRLIGRETADSHPGQRQ